MATLKKDKAKTKTKEPEKPALPEKKLTFPKEKPKHWLEAKQKFQENPLVKARDSRRLQMVSGKRGK